MPRLPAMAVPPITVPIIRSGKVSGARTAKERLVSAKEKAKQRRQGIERGEFAHEDVTERTERLREQAEDEHPLGAKAVAEQAEGYTATHSGEAFHAVDGDRGDHRYAATDGVAHGVDDRSRMRGAAEEVR